MVFTVLVNIVLCPFSHTSIAIDTSLYVLVQDVSQLTPEQIREQISQGLTVIGYSIVKVKGVEYLLTRAKNSKKFLTSKGWLDLKTQGKHQYLYQRWRDGVKQKSRCLGRVDRLE